jgi:small subunit ribosomal protein S21
MRVSLKLLKELAELFKFLKLKQKEDLGMNGIIIRENEPLEKAMRRFVKVCEKSGVLSELKKYRHYEKPSEERKRKKNSTMLRILRDQKRETIGYESRARSNGK